MKKTAIYVFVMLLTVFTQSCSEKKLSASEVPTSVVSSFNAKYPNASDVEWEKEDEKGTIVYEVECKFNGKETKAKFNEDGSFVAAENE